MNVVIVIVLAFLSQTTSCFGSETNSTTTDEVLELLEQTVMAHNEYREKHNATSLMINPELVDLAQSQAEKFAETGHITHATIKYRNQTVGQNFALSQGITLKGNELTKLWYSSGRSFDYERANSLQNADTFTQVIWKSTQEMGLGLARQDNNVYIICLYFPAGNIVEDIPENVYPPKELNLNKTKKIFI